MKLIMQNKAKFQKSQMFITLMKTMNYNEKYKLDTWSKQTQTKPILPAPTVGKIALSAVEGPIKTNIHLRRIQNTTNCAFSWLYKILCVLVSLWLHSAKRREPSVNWNNDAGNEFRRVA
jgi:hypothetical protein